MPLATPSAPLRACLTLVSAILVAAPLAALAADVTPQLSLHGDVRLRYESDWDSHTPGGARRVDRERGRARVRAGLGYKFSSRWSAGARIRTGDPHSQQSPHLTFTASDGPNDDFNASFDRYFIQFKDLAFTAWAGRNGTPFWQQNEMTWDEDVTPTGLAASYDAKQGPSTLTTTVGAFALPDGMTRLHGRLVAGQLKYSRSFQPSQFTFAAGLHSFDGKPGARYLRNRNGARGYLIGIASAQWSTPVSGRPLTFGVDLIENFESYHAADAFPLAPVAADETTGYVVSLQLGQLKQARDWLIACSWARIGALAVNSSYSQDDWARWGSGPQSDVSDFQGHEFRAAYAITRDLNLMARAFFVEALTSAQDGKRFRLDLNWKW